MRRLNLGCGIYKEDGFINIDSDPSTNAEVIRDVTKGLPFDNSSVDEVRAYHFLEHLRSFDDFMFVLGEAFRVLKEGGIFDIRVPIAAIGSTHAFHPDHSLYFNERSFVPLTDPSFNKHYRGNMDWEVVKQFVLDEPLGKSFQILLRAKK